MSETSPPAAPEPTAPSATGEPVVTLRGGALQWRPVSSALVTVRLIVLGVFLAVPMLVTAGLALLVTGWLWLGTLAVVLVGAWATWVVTRQVSAISWVELDEEIVIRKGRLFRTLVSVPYGRLQYVDIQSGPLARAFGLASCEIHTASPESGGSLPGLPTDEAEALRARLAARGEAQRAGL